MHFTFTTFSSITSITCETGVGGIQNNNDQLFVNGNLFASGTQIPNQGAFGYGILTYNLTAFAASLLTSPGEIRFNLNSNSSGEPVVFDYAYTF